MEILSARKYADHPAHILSRVALTSSYTAVTHLLPSRFHQARPSYDPTQHTGSSVNLNPTSWLNANQPRAGGNKAPGLETNETPDGGTAGAASVGCWPQVLIFA